MGFTRVTVTVRNPADRSRSWQGLFLVDTGALDAMVPATHLRAIGIEPLSHRTYELADGSKVTMDTGGTMMEILGDIIFTQVAFGPDNAEPNLGVLALEAMGIEIDPVTQELRRRPALRMK